MELLLFVLCPLVNNNAKMTSNKPISKCTYLCSVKLMSTPLSITEGLTEESCWGYVRGSGGKSLPPHSTRVKQPGKSEFLTLMS